MPRFTELRKEAANHPLEKVGTGLRAMMPWSAQNRLVDKQELVAMDCGRISV